jgi:hypothetical protein
VSNIAPILWIKGRVRQVREPRTVPAVAAAPAMRDPETGRVTREPVEARDAYEVTEIVVDTDPGGLLTVICRDQALKDAEGYVPTEGETVELPVRAYDNWQGRPNRRYRVPGYSFAGAVYAAAAKGRTGGARAALATA